MEAGDLVFVDTDAVGIEGYFADVSRTFLVGDVPATPIQRDAYAAAHDWLVETSALLRPGSRCASSPNWHPGSRNDTGRNGTNASRTRPGSTTKDRRSRGPKTRTRTVIARSNPAWSCVSRCTAATLAGETV